MILKARHRLLAFPR